jgi:hypothetical protein
MNLYSSPQPTPETVVLFAWSSPFQAMSPYGERVSAPSEPFAMPVMS